MFGVVCILIVHFYKDILDREIIIAYSIQNMVILAC